MEISEFLEEFPKEMKKKGWNLYMVGEVNHPEEVVKKADELKDETIKKIIEKGSAEKLKLRTGYIIFPHADYHSIKELEEVCEITLFPACYRYRGICYPIQLFVIDEEGWLGFLIDLKLLSQFYPDLMNWPLLYAQNIYFFNFLIPIPYIDASVEEFVKISFNQWKNKLSE